MTTRVLGVRAAALLELGRARRRDVDEVHDDVQWMGVLRSRQRAADVPARHARARSTAPARCGSCCSSRSSRARSPAALSRVREALDAPAAARRTRCRRSTSSTRVLAGAAGARPTTAPRSTRRWTRCSWRSPRSTIAVRRRVRPVGATDAASVDAMRYAPARGRFDEAVDADGSLRPAWAELRRRARRRSTRRSCSSGSARPTACSTPRAPATWCTSSRSSATADGGADAESRPAAAVAARPGAAACSSHDEFDAARRGGDAADARARGAARRPATATQRCVRSGVRAAALLFALRRAPSGCDPAAVGPWLVHYALDVVRDRDGRVARGAGPHRRADRARLRAAEPFGAWPGVMPDGAAPVGRRADRDRSPTCCAARSPRSRPPAGAARAPSCSAAGPSHPTYVEHSTSRRSWASTSPRAATWSSARTACGCARSTGSSRSTSSTAASRTQRSTRWRSTHAVAAPACPASCGRRRRRRCRAGQRVRHARSPSRRRCAALLPGWPRSAARRVAAAAAARRPASSSATHAGVRRRRDRLVAPGRGRACACSWSRRPTASR